MSEQQQGKTTNGQPQEPELKGESPSRSRKDRFAEDAASITRQFGNHVAVHASAAVGDKCVERLRWSQPGTRNRLIDYTCIGGSLLIVTGDLGDAIYNAGGDSLKWWVRCDCDYLSRKCIASEYGTGYKEFNRDDALRRVVQEVADMRENGETVADDLVTAARDAILGGKGEWDAWMREDASELFGDDWWENVPDYGMVVAYRCRAHLIGLQMAWAQLDAHTIAATHQELAGVSS